MRDLYTRAHKKAEHFGEMCVRAMKNVSYKQEALFLCVAVLLVILALQPYWESAGIPVGHEGLSYIARAQLYAEQFRQGNWLPIWSSSDMFWFGSPLPLFYQKIFYYVAGVLFLVLTPKVAITAALGVFYLVGLYGMRFAVRSLAVPARYEYVAPLVFALSFYVFSDWLVRSAMAEFSAMMFIPWLLGLCLFMIRTGRWSWGIPFVLLLIFFSHNILAIFALIVMLLAFVAGVIRHKRRRRELVRRSLLSAVLFLVCVLPSAVLQLALLHDYDPSKITQPPYNVERYVVAWEDLISLDRFVWMDSLALTLQWDPGVLILVPILCVGWIVLLVRSVFLRKKKMRETDSGIGVRLAESIFFIVGVFLYAYLQLSHALWVYQALPFLGYIQFPWRLSAFITPMLILLAVLWLSQLIKSKWIAVPIVLGWLVVTLWYSPVLSRSEVPDHITHEQLDESLALSSKGWGAILTAVGEYLPVVQDDQGVEQASIDTLYWYMDQHEQGSTHLYEHDMCSVRQLEQYRFEQRSSVFVVSCSAESAVPLSVSYSPFHEVRRVMRDDEIRYESLPYTRVRTDPRLYVHIPPTEMPWVIQVDHPTVWQAFVRVFTGKAPLW